jgi:uncharacterized membrane protein YedE/YeeE
MADEQTAVPGGRLGARFPWLQGIAEDYRQLLVEPWSPAIGAILLALLCAVLMLHGLFWGVFGGLKLWGDYLNTWLGLAPLLGIPAELDHPLQHRTSLMNITLLLGAFSAALMSRQFRINRPPPLELLWGALGGTLMGLGATLAGGCTIGGFLTPLMFSSAAGWVMWAGLIIGAFIGLKLLLWTLEHISWGMQPPQPRPQWAIRRYYPLAGLLILAAVSVWAYQWFTASEKNLLSRAIIIPVAFAIGFVIHRSRLCFARAIREPLMTAEGEMPRAMMLTLAIGIPLGALLIQKGTVDAYVAIPATFWAGSLGGGIVFGIGMIFAGGCGSGSLWRLSEGHIKLMVATLFFAWTGSIFSALFKQAGLSKRDIDIDFLDGMAEISALGFQAYMPDLLDGWGSALLVSLLLLIAWYLLVRYNEKSERFTVL